MSPTSRPDPISPFPTTSNQLSTYPISFPPSDPRYPRRRGRNVAGQPFPSPASPTRLPILRLRRNLLLGPDLRARNPVRPRHAHRRMELGPSNPQGEFL